MPKLIYVFHSVYKAGRSRTIIKVPSLHSVYAYYEQVLRTSYIALLNIISNQILVQILKGIRGLNTPYTHLHECREKENTQKRIMNELIVKTGHNRRYLVPK